MCAQDSQPEMIFYDGYCALCHGTVKFVVRHDRKGLRFRFAPLQGATFDSLVPREQRTGLPDSIVVRTSQGNLLARSEAIIHILRSLGGGWSNLASLLSVLPRPLRDAGYNFVARVRYRVFGRRNEVCPVLPADLRARFDP
jgi:predicted DCC family thiol-disulfide oxidoreductase YuxK